MNSSSINGAPDYSVVIPTQGHRRTLDRAIESALAQTLPPASVIVVVDGRPMPDSNFKNHNGLVWTTPDKGSGGQLARLHGVRLTTTSWVAFLDDDDWWESGKMERQLGSLVPAPGFSILSCRCSVGFSDGGNVVLPRQLPREGQALGDYLFERTSLSWGDALVQTSTLVVPTSQAKRALRPETSLHQDWDLLFALERQGGRLNLLPDALTHYESADGARVSGNSRWRDSLAWGREWRTQMGRPAYSSFVLVTVAGRTRGRQRLVAAPVLLLEGVLRGRPRLRHLAFFAGLIVSSHRLRQALRQQRKS